MITLSGVQDHLPISDRLYKLHVCLGGNAKAIQQSGVTFCEALTLSGKIGFLVGLTFALAGLDFTSSAPASSLPTKPKHTLTHTYGTVFP